MENLIKKTRTYRRFDASYDIDQNLLLELIELGRLGGSARNCQPWQYLLISKREICDTIFPHLAWAGYLSDWKGPAQHERPTAYILCFLNSEWLLGSREEAYFDLGIATQNILLGATKSGLGGCRIGAFSPKLASLFKQPDHLQLAHVIALGKPTETVIIEDCKDAKKVKYWRDENNIHHVPKRILSEVVLSSPFHG